MIGDGMHLMIDGVVAETVKKETVTDLLSMMPEAIGMTRIDYPSINGSPKGWAGIQLIAESHIAFHSAGHKIHIDIFSCKWFSLDEALTLVQELVPMDQYKVQMIPRGWR